MPSPSPSPWIRPGAPAKAADPESPGVPRPARAARSPQRCPEPDAPVLRGALLAAMAQARAALLASVADS
jgi:hypothetical protein